MLWLENSIAFESKGIVGKFLVVQWLALGAFTDGAWVQPLVRELRSCKPCDMDKIFFKCGLLLFKFLLLYYFLKNLVIMPSEIIFLSKHRLNWYLQS